MYKKEQDLFLCFVVNTQQIFSSKHRHLNVMAIVQKQEKNISPQEEVYSTYCFFSFKK